MKNSSLLFGWFQNENKITEWIISHESEMIETANYIFEHPEVAYKEVISSKCLA